MGDIQGCRDELARLLDRVRFDPAADTIHFAGDLVNRGPDSLGVLRLLRDAGATGVLGNHDVHLLRVAADLRTKSERDTFDDVLDAADRDPLLAWLATQPFVREWDDVILVHAALHPAWTRDPSVPIATWLRDATPFDPGANGAFATCVRYCAADGTRPEHDWPPPDAPFAPWFELFPGNPADRRVVVFGHWARMGLVVRPQVRGLDTGCVWGKQLTAWIAEEDRLVHVDAARVHSSHRSE